jgi:drug/metabolite transporter (DMT)-like permease
VTVECSATVGVICGVLGALGQAGGYTISKLALDRGLDPLSATVIRVGAAVVAVWLLAPFQGGVRGSFTALRDRRAAGFMVAGSVLGPFVGVTLSLVALARAPAAVAASIIASYPLLAMAISARFHGERLTVRLLGGAILTVAGVVVLFLR